MKFQLPLFKSACICIFFCTMIATANAATITEFVPPNDPVGMVFSMNSNDGYSNGRGIVFEAMSDVNIESIGFFHDLTNIAVTYTVSEINQLTGNVETGQTVLSTGSATFTTNGLEWIDFTFPPILLQSGSFYHLDFEFQGDGNQNFFYNNDNVPWDQGDFRLLEGTQDGSAGNFIVPAIRVVCPDPVNGVPTLGQWGLLILSLGMLIIGVISTKEYSQRLNIGSTR